MTISKTIDGSKLVVKVSGSLDITTSPELQQELDASLDGVESLAFDFSELDYISSAGLRVLVSTHKKMYKKGGMVITGVNESVMDVFDITGLADSFTIEPLEA